MNHDMKDYRGISIEEISDIVEDGIACILMCGSAALMIGLLWMAWEWL